MIMKIDSVLVSPTLHLPSLSIDVVNMEAITLNYHQCDCVGPLTGERGGKRVCRFHTMHLIFEDDLREFIL